MATKLQFQIHTTNGHGWEKECCEETQEAADAILLDYQRAGVCAKIVKRRVPIDPETGAEIEAEPVIKHYRIVRFFHGHPKQTVRAKCTLEEAQRHCNDPESSSRTCTAATGKRLTREHGMWFDGYEAVFK